MTKVRIDSPIGLIPVRPVTFLIVQFILIVTFGTTAVYTSFMGYTIMGIVSSILLVLSVLAGWFTSITVE